MTMLLVYLALALGVSFLCSLLEASLLSIPAGYVAMMVQQGQAAGARLERMKANIDRPLAAILTLNTIAHTVGAAGVGAQAQVVFGKAWVAVTSAVLTLLILLLSEIIPKTLGAVHARRLATFTAWTVHVMILTLYPLVRACEVLSNLVGGRKVQPPLTRSEMIAVTELGRQHGQIDRGESRVIRNLLTLKDVHVKDILTPRAVVFSLPADWTVSQALDKHQALPFSRIPVIEGDLDHIVGLVLRAQILDAYREGRPDQKLADLANPIRTIPENAPVDALLEQFIQHREQLFQVVDEYGGTEGVVTLEDAIETLLGVEIVDETDTVRDMRELARRLAQTRHQRRFGKTT